MARRGGYYDTFYSMHSHEAILAALLGQELLRCDLSTMCRQADEAGLCYDFQFVDDLPVRPRSWRRWSYPAAAAPSG